MVINYNNNNPTSKQVCSVMLTIQQLAVINCHPSHTTDEFEVREVIFVTQARVWIYLEGVIIPVKTNHIS